MARSLLALLEKGAAVNSDEVPGRSPVADFLPPQLGSCASGTNTIFEKRSFSDQGPTAPKKEPQKEKQQRERVFMTINVVIVMTMTMWTDHTGSPLLQAPPTLCQVPAWTVLVCGLEAGFLPGPRAPAVRPWASNKS